MKELVMFDFYPYIYYIKDENNKVIWNSFTPYSDGNHYRMIDIKNHMPSSMNKESTLFIFEE